MLSDEVEGYNSWYLIAAAQVLTAGSQHHLLASYFASRRTPIFILCGGNWKVTWKVLKINASEFVKDIDKKSRNYSPIKPIETTVSIKELFTIDSREKIRDQDFHNLMLYGTRTRDMINESLSTGRRFILFREKCNEVFRYFDNGHRLVTICSDLGNGKSVLLDTLREIALEQGYRVFEAIENNEEAFSDLEIISRIKGKVLVTIEEYSDWLYEIGDLITRASDNVKVVTTARNYVNDTHYEDLQIITGIEKIPEIGIDILNDREIDWFIDALQEHGLWGDLASYTKDKKRTLIIDDCKSQIHAILLKIIESPDIGNRFRALINTIKTNRTRYKILVGIFIMTVLNQRPNFETIVDIFGPEYVSSSQFRNDPIVKQFLDYTHNRILLKSPIATLYLLQNIADPAFTLSVLKEIAESADRNALASKRYRKMMSTYMVYNRIQSVLPTSRGVDLAISYYESIKDLTQCKESPLFWLQYAIPCLLKGDLPSCKKYLDTAYSYARVQNWDTFQLDNWYARYLLEKTTKGVGVDEAKDNFRQAKNIVLHQIQNEPLRRHPYRVATLLGSFYRQYKQLLEPDDIDEVLQTATSILNSIDNLPKDRKSKPEIYKCRNAMNAILGKRRI